MLWKVGEEEGAFWMWYPPCYLNPVLSGPSVGISEKVEGHTVSCQLKFQNAVII